jgi:hypothetical protein
LGTHYFAVFLVIAAALLLLRRYGRLRSLLVGMAVVAGAELVLLPLLLKQRSEGHAASLISSASLQERLGQLGWWFGTGDFRSTLAVAAAGILVLVGVVLLLLRGRPRGGITALEVGVGTLSVPLLLVVAGADYIFFRNLIVAWVPIAVAVAAGFMIKRWGIVAAGLLCAVFLVADVAVFGQAKLHRDDWRAAAARMTAAPGPAAIVVYPAWDSQPLSYYAPRLVAFPNDPVRVRSLWFVGVSSQFSAWNPPATLRLRVPAGFRLTGSEHLQHFVLRHFTAIRPVKLTAAQLTDMLPEANGRSTPHLRATLDR